MEKKPRSLTVSESADHQPRIILKGKWLRDWGFTRGDKVSVTRTDSGDILITFTAPGNIWSALRRKYRHKYEAVPVQKVSRFRLRMMHKQIDIADEACRRWVCARAANNRGQLLSKRQPTEK
jgi:hypothetical protein